MSKINNRPMSPHLTVYKPQLTAVLSIFNRITGVLLSMVAYLLLLGNQLFDLHLSNYSIYNIAHFINLSSHWFLISVLFLIFLCVYYHLINGVRHLIWDTGSALEMPNVYRTGYTVIALVLLSIISTWAYLMA